jgi:CheY-like chemotaxis protein
MSDKRSPIAALASTIAHDLNNPLSYMLSNLRFCQDLLAKDALAPAEVKDLRDALGDVSQGIDKLRAIVSGLKSVAAAEEALAEDTESGDSGGPKLAAKNGKAPIVVIDDDKLIALAIARVLSPEHEIVSFADARDALAWLETNKPALVLCDIQMPAMSGFEFYSRLGETKSYPRDRVVFITGNPLGEETRRFLASIENPRVHKPFEPDTLRAVVRAFSR